MCFLLERKTQHT